MIKKIIMLGSCLLVAFSCTSPQKLLNDKSAERLYFGNYGGFANASVDYVLIDNTIIFKSDKNNLTPVVKLQHNNILNVRQLVSKAGIETLELNEPGNLTYYIRIVKPGVDKEIKWSDTRSNTDVNQLYNTLMSYLKK